jgi:hypothetical protein
MAADAIGAILGTIGLMIFGWISFARSPKKKDAEKKIEDDICEEIEPDVCTEAARETWKEENEELFKEIQKKYKPASRRFWLIFSIIFSVLTGIFFMYFAYAMIQYRRMKKAEAAAKS